MIADIGHVLLWVALTANIVTIVVPLYNLVKKRPKPYEVLEKLAIFTTCTMACAITLAFGCLMYVHIISDYSVVHVMQYSHHLKPLLYRVTGVWGNHEGSILLWLWIMSLYGLWFAQSKKVPTQSKGVVLVIFHAIIIGFTLFILLTSNPFIRVAGAVALEGLGLNPLLQDIGLAMHPPTLYVGYVGASLLFAIMLAILWEGNFSKQWAKAMKPFVITSWSALTAGIGLGSWWAYRELGWGGFWFWDPVENVSMLPWLSLTALMHSLIIVEKRNYLKGWTVFLGIITFLYSVIGAFLVRSGILTSVHSFAEDSSRGIFILMLFIAWGVAGIMAFVLRGYKLIKVPDYNLKSKEGLILINNVLLVILSLIVLIGTIYPIILEATIGHRVTVGSPYYNITFNSIAIWLLGLAAVAPATKWKKSKILEDINKQLLIIAISVLYGALVWWYYPQKFWVTYPAIMLAIWLILSMGTLWWKRIKVNTGTVWDNIKSTPATFHAMVLAHIGAAICVLGISFASGWSEEKEAMVHVGEKLVIKRAEATLDRIEHSAIKNYVTRIATVRLTADKGNKELAVLTPELRFYPVEGQQTTEASIHSTIGHDIYAVIGEHNKEQGYALRVYIKPMISWIWTGVVLMTLAGVIVFIRSLKDDKRNT